MYLKVLKGESGQWYVQLVSDGNHEILMHSETYDSKDNARRAAQNLSDKLSLTLVVKDVE